MASRTRTLTAMALLLLGGCGNDSSPSQPNTDNNSGAVEVPDSLLQAEVSGQTVAVPMISSHDLNTIHPEVTRVVLVVPSSTRTILDKYDILEGMAREEGQQNTTMIFGMQFLETEDIGQPGLAGNILYWEMANNWSSGFESLGTAGGNLDVHVSSYTMIDTAITRIIAACPNLQVLMFTGNSAGGATSQHYANDTSMPELYPEIKFGFMPSNMVSIAYFTPERVVTGTMDQFAVPMDACPEYDNYPFGMTNISELVPGFTAEDFMIRYKTRYFTYIVGSEDHTNYDECQIDVQGPDNYARNVIYFNYLHHLYGDIIDETQQQVVIEGVDHPGPKMFKSNASRYTLFHWIPGQSFEFGG